MICTQLVKLIENVKNKYSSLLLFKKNFDKEGNYYDEYFGTLSDTKKAIWILISLDHKLPRKLKENIIIVKKKNIIAFLSYI